MPFIQRGFLGEDGKAFVESHRNNYKIWFDAAEEFNEVAQVLIGKMNINSSDIRQLTCASLFLRIVSSYSSAIKLLELGLSQDSGTVIRSAVESVIYLKACAEIPDFVESYHYAQEGFRLKLVNIALKGEPGAIDCDEESKPKLQSIKAQIEKLKDEGKISEIDIATLSKTVGLAEIYNTAYRFLSNTSVHSSSSSLLQYFKFRADGSIEAILWKPNSDDLETFMFTANSALLIAFTVISTTFSMSSEIVDPLGKRIDEALEPIKKMPSPAKKEFK